MTCTDLRAWAKRLGYTYEQAAGALGVSRATWAAWVSGRTKIDRRTRLACVAIEAGL